MRNIFFFVALISLLGRDLGSEYTHYRVQKGDNLYKLAKSLRVDYLSLIRLNGKRSLKVGEKIKIPSFIIYKVKWGDSYFKIASHFDLPIQELMAANSDRPRLYADTFIQIPIQPDSLRLINNTAGSDIRWKEVASHLSFVWPATGKLLVSYEEVDAIMNYGIQIELKKKSVVSIEQGEVILASRLRGLGYTLVVEHPKEVISLYSGLNRAFKNKGDIVKRKEKIAVGQDIIFFSIYRKGSPFDPLKVIHP